MPDMCKTLQVSFEDRTVIASNPLLQLRAFFFKGNYKKLNYLELDKCSQLDLNFESLLNTRKHTDLFLWC